MSRSAVREGEVTPAVHSRPCSLRGRPVTVAALADQRANARRSLIASRTISGSVISRGDPSETWCGVSPECSLIVPSMIKVDVPDPVAEQGPVKGKSTEGSDDEDREQRPYRCG